MSPEVPLPERLERLMTLHEAAHEHAGDAQWKMGLYPPATNAQLERLEGQLGRLLPEEARDLYLWHNGCGYTPFVPLVYFPKLDVAYKWWLAVRPLRIPFPISNGDDAIDVRTLFRVFNIEKLDLAVMTTVGRRMKTSPIYFLRLETSRLTLAARSLRDCIDHWIALLEGGHFTSTEHGLEWTRKPFALFES